MTTTEVILDPATGEVMTPAERDELVAEYAARLVAATRAAAEIEGLKQRILDLADPSHPLRVDGWTVAVESGGKTPRQVRPEAIREHEEALRPLGLAPKPQPPREVADRMPGVAEIVKAKDDLLRAGLTPDTLIAPGVERAPVVRVVAPEAAA